MKATINIKLPSKTKTQNKKEQILEQIATTCNKGHFLKESNNNMRPHTDRVSNNSKKDNMMGLLAEKGSRQEVLCISLKVSSVWNDNRM